MIQGGWRNRFTREVQNLLTFMVVWVRVPPLPPHQTSTGLTRASYLPHSLSGVQASRRHLTAWQQRTRCPHHGWVHRQSPSLSGFDSPVFVAWIEPLVTVSGFDQSRTLPYRVVAAGVFALCGPHGVSKTLTGQVRAPFMVEASRIKAVRSAAVMVRDIEVLLACVRA